MYPRLMRFPRAVVARLTVGFALIACAGLQAQALPPIAVESYPAVSRQPIAQALIEARAHPDDAARLGHLAMVLHAWEQVRDGRRRLRPGPGSRAPVRLVLPRGPCRNAPGPSRRGRATAGRRRAAGPRLRTGAAGAGRRVVRIRRRGCRRHADPALTTVPARRMRITAWAGAWPRKARKTRRCASSRPPCSCSPNSAPPGTPKAMVLRGLGRCDEARKALARASSSARRGRRWTIRRSPGCGRCARTPART